MQTLWRLALFVEGQGKTGKNNIRIRPLFLYQRSYLSFLQCGKVVGDARQHHDRALRVLRRGIECTRDRLADVATRSAATQGQQGGQQ